MAAKSKTEEFMIQVFCDLGAAGTAALVILGDHLGLFEKLAAIGPSTPAELAKATGCNERLIREWLSAMACASYVTVDHAAGKFSLSEEQRAVFAEPNNPYYVAGAFEGMASIYVDEPLVRDAYKSGKGLGWEKHAACLYCGTARIFSLAYKTFLVQEWIPAMKGMSEKLKKGGRAADIGCGHGVSTILMARAFPQSRFVGYDFHAPSVACATEEAKKQGVTNVEFKVAKAKEIAERDFDLVCCFDCLHDMGDPVGASKHVKSMLKPDGAWMVVEPLAGNSLAENMNPNGRLYYSFSATVCVPASQSQEVGAALGAQAGEKKLRETIMAGGFKDVRRVAETPANMVLMATP